MASSENLAISLLIFNRGVNYVSEERRENIKKKVKKCENLENFAE